MIHKAWERVSRGSKPRIYSSPYKTVLSHLCIAKGLTLSKAWDRIESIGPRRELRVLLRMHNMLARRAIIAEHDSSRLIGDRVFVYNSRTSSSHVPFGTLEQYRSSQC